MLSFDNRERLWSLEPFRRRMIKKVTRNVSRASPKPTAMTIPATVPFGSRLLCEVGPFECEVGLGDVETELREEAVDWEPVAFAVL